MPDFAAVVRPCVFCRAFTDMRLDAWLAAHVAAFHAVGGVPRIDLPTNALTATHRKAKGGPGSSMKGTGRWPTTMHRHRAGPCEETP